MSHKTPRERRREATLDRIVTAALEVVRAEGLAALTMTRLAHMVQYTPGALYRYFPSKGALIAELNRRVLQDTLDVLGRARERQFPSAADGSTAALARLVASSAALVAEAVARPAAFAVIAATLGDPTRLVSDDEAVHLPVLELLLSALATDIAAAAHHGALRGGSASDRALRWVFGTVGILQLGKLAERDTRLRPGPLAEGLATDLFLGWGATPEALVAAQALTVES